MISQADKLPALSERSPELTRIKAVYTAYGNGYDFLKLFVQTIDERVTAVALAFYGTLHIAALDGADCTELADFYRMRPDLVSFRTHSPELAQEFDNLQTGTAWVKDNIPADCDGALFADYKKSFSILAKTFPGQISPDDYPLWYCDFSHRARHGVGGVYCYESSATVTVYGTDSDYAFLGQIAVLDKGKGTGGRMLCALGNKLTAARLAVDSKSPRADGFYKKQGFSAYGHWFEHRKYDR